MPAYVDELDLALQNESDDAPIFDWLALCLNTEWTNAPTPNSRTWTPARATHTFTIKTDSAGRKHLTYGATVFKSNERHTALQLCDSLNRRAFGGSFVVLRDKSEFQVRAMARCDLSTERWYVAATFSSTIQVLMGLVEHIIVRPDVWRNFDCSPCATETSVPMFNIPYALSRIISDDPYSPR